MLSECSGLLGPNSMTWICTDIFDQLSTLENTKSVGNKYV